MPTIWDEVAAQATEAVQRCGIYAKRDGSCECGAKPVLLYAPGVYEVNHTPTCRITRNARIEAFVKERQRKAVESAA